MYALLTKLFFSPKKQHLITPTPDDADFVATGLSETQVGKQLKEKIGSLFKGSLAIRVVTAGSTADPEQELNALGNFRYDMDRFGVHVVASPRHADMLIVTGPVSRNMRQGLLRAYEAMPEPKIVVALGDDAIDGGIFKGSYAVEGGAHMVVPVDYQIPGNPPPPRMILSSLVAILEDIEKRSRS